MILKLSHLRFFLLTTLLVVATSSTYANDRLKEVEKRLQAVKTDSPRETMMSFMQAMENYRKGITKHDPLLTASLNDAIDCLDTTLISKVTEDLTPEQAAIFLKETIDRVVKIDPNRIPDNRDEKVWHLINTQIKIRLIEEGDRAGEYLFDKFTVEQSREMFKKVQELPYAPGSGKGAGFREPFLERVAPTWAKQTFLSIAYWQWIGLFVFILLGLTMRLLARLGGNMLHRMTQHTDTDWDDLLIESMISPVSLLVASGIWYLSLFVLQFEGIPFKVLNVIIQITLTVSLIWVFYSLAHVFSAYLMHLAKKTKTGLDDQIVRLISRTLKVFVIIMGIMLGIQNLGVNVFSLLAGMGIVGLAVAMAAKDSLSNFFASVIIMLDRPFQIGDWIIVGDKDGTVEDIGFRSTKIRTFYNSVVSIPNSEIANTGVDNMGLRKYRRVKTFLGVTYDTPAEKIEAFLEGIKNIIKANPNTRKDYFHVVFNQFGPSSLDIMLYFFLKVPDWSNELVERQNVFLEIVRLAEDLGVEFAFPTQTLHIMDLPGNPPHDPGHNRDSHHLSESVKRFAPGGEQSKPAGSGLFVPPFKDPELS
ncbi:MAG: mechanosensitive ion channel family protein [Verrucomicrobiota bacterium]